MKDFSVFSAMTAALMLSASAWAAGDVKVEVHGMVCSFCAQGITKKLKAERAVDAVDVKLGDHRVMIKLKDGMDLADARITEILTEAGYAVGKIER